MADLLHRAYTADYISAVPSITSHLGDEICRLRGQGRPIPSIVQELGMFEANAWRSLRKC